MTYINHDIKFKETKQKFSTFFQKGNYLMRYNQIDEAIEAYQKATKEHPTFYCIYQNLGEALTRKNYINEAIKNYKLAIKYNSKALNAYIYLIELLVQAEKIEEAREIYLSGVQLKPSLFQKIFSKQDNNDFFQHLHGRIFLQQIQARKQDRDPWKIPHMVAQNIKRKGDINQSIEAYQHAININPDFFQSYLELGNLFILQKNWKAAESCYKKAIDLNSKCSWCYYNLGKVLEKKNQLKEAEVAYHTAIDICPNKYYEFYYTLGKLLNYLKQWDKSYSLLQIAIRLSYTHKYSYWELGRAAFHLKKWNNAIEAFNQYIELQGEENVNFWKMMGKALQERKRDSNDIQQALNNYIKVLKNEPDNYENYLEVLNMKIEDPYLYLRLRNILNGASIKKENVHVLLGSMLQVAAQNEN